MRGSYETYINTIKDNQEIAFEKMKKNDFQYVDPAKRPPENPVALTPLPNAQRNKLKSQKEKKEFYVAERKAVVLRTVEYTRLKKDSAHQKFLDDNFIDNLTKNYEIGEVESKSKKRKKENEKTCEPGPDPGEVITKLLKNPVDVIQRWWHQVKRARRRKYLSKEYSKYISIAIKIMNKVIREKRIKIKRNVLLYLFHQCFEKINQLMPKDIIIKNGNFLFKPIYKKRRITRPSIFTKEEIYYEHKSQELDAVLVLQKRIKLFLNRKKSQENSQKTMINVESQKSSRNRLMELIGDDSVENNESPIKVEKENENENIVENEDLLRDEIDRMIKPIEPIPIEKVALNTDMFITKSIFVAPKTAINQVICIQNNYKLFNEKKRLESLRLSDEIYQKPIVKDYSDSFLTKERVGREPLKKILEEISQENFEIIADASSGSLEDEAKKAEEQAAANRREKMKLLEISSKAEDFEIGIDENSKLRKKHFSVVEIGDLIGINVESIPISDEITKFETVITNDKNTFETESYKKKEVKKSTSKYEITKELDMEVFKEVSKRDSSQLEDKAKIQIEKYLDQDFEVEYMVPEESPKKILRTFSNLQQESKEFTFESQKKENQMVAETNHFDIIAEREQIDKPSEFSQTSQILEVGYSSLNRPKTSQKNVKGKLFNQNGLELYQKPRVSYMDKKNPTPNENTQTLVLSKVSSEKVSILSDQEFEKDLQSQSKLYVVEDNFQTAGQARGRNRNHPSNQNVDDYLASLKISTVSNKTVYLSKEKNIQFSIESQPTKRPTINNENDLKMNSYYYISKVEKLKRKKLHKSRTEKKEIRQQIIYFPEVQETKRISNKREFSKGYYISKERKERKAKAKKLNLEVSRMNELCYFRAEDSYNLTPINKLRKGLEVTQPKGFDLLVLEKERQENKTPDRKFPRKEKVDVSPCKSDNGCANQYNNSRRNILRKILKDKENRINDKISEMEKRYNVNVEKMNTLTRFVRKKLPNIMKNILTKHIKGYLYKIYNYDYRKEKIIKLVKKRRNPLLRYFNIWRENLQFIESEITQNSAISFPSVYYNKKQIEKLVNAISLINREFFYRIVMISMLEDGIDINNKAVVSFLNKGFSYGYLFTLGNVLKLKISNNYFYVDMERNHNSYMKQLVALNTETNAYIAQQPSRGYDIPTRHNKEKDRQIKFKK